MIIRYIFYLISKVKRTNSHKPVIDYDIAAIFSPTIFVGSLFGILFNQILPEWILYAAYLIFMSFTIVNCFKKWRV